MKEVASRSFDKTRTCEQSIVQNKFYGELGESSGIGCSL